MTRTIIIDDFTSKELRVDILNFFKKFNFEHNQIDKNVVLFSKKASLLDGWKASPLDWGSNITISILKDSIKISSSLQTSGQLKTYEEIKVWDEFFNYFENFLLDQKSDNSEFLISINECIKSKIYYLSYAVLGVLIGSIFSYIFTKFFGVNFLIGVLFIPFSVKVILKYKVNTNKYRT